MKKYIVLGLLAAMLLVIGLGIWYMTAGSLSVTTGRVLVADNGSVLLIAENSPIVLAPRGGAGMFDRIATGDQVLVIHDGIAESYPARTGAYFILRQGGGTLEDLPQQALDTLRELGWIQ